MRTYSLIKPSDGTQGEQFLHDGDVCNLGAINLEKFVTADGRVNYERLKTVTRTAVRMLDNVIDITDFPVEKVNKTARDNRRIGLGIMGFADMLYQLGVGYGTDEGRAIASRVMETINVTAADESSKLAAAKGNFPNWDKSVFAASKTPMRNAALTNVAPTGTIGMIFDVSGGVEPYFALAYYYKNILGGNVKLSYVNKHLKKALEAHGIYSDALLDEIVSKGSLQHLTQLPVKLRETFVTAMDITAEQHIRMQATFQRHCNNSISKTINFQNGATRDDIRQGYLLAWELGCKGCTVYRDGSREEQVLNLNSSADTNSGILLSASTDTTASKAIVAVIDALVVGTEHKKGECSSCKTEMRRTQGCLECPSCGVSMCEA